MLTYYFHSAVNNAYLVWGSSAPQLIPYGMEPDRLPMSFTSDQEAQAFISHWQHNGVNAHAIREAQLVILRTDQFKENMRTGRQRYSIDLRADLRHTDRVQKSIVRGNMPEQL